MANLGMVDTCILQVKKDGALFLQLKIAALDALLLWLYNHRYVRQAPKINGQLAIAELKIWSVPRSKDYPEGRKFSLFLVAGGKVILGIDNHKPKGPHLHLGEQELPYIYHDKASLLRDFWEWVRKVGYEP